MYDRDLIISQIRQRLEILYQMVEELENQSPGPSPGGTTDYNDLSNKPQIEGTTLSGNKTAAQLGLATSSSVSSITSRFEDLITPDNITIEDNEQVPSTIDSRLALHQPIMLNHAIYYCYDESGIDYTYVALDTSGAYPKLSYAQILKEDKRVHFYDFATDTVPTSSSDNFITSGGVYTSQAAQDTLITGLTNKLSLTEITNTSVFTYIDSLTIGTHWFYTEANTGCTDVPQNTTCFYNVYKSSENTTEIVAFCPSVSWDWAFYLCSKTSGTWHDWKRFGDAFRRGILWDSTAVPSQDALDLNTITTPGRYMTSGTTVASRLANKPPYASAGSKITMYEVIQFSSSGLMQKCYVYKGGTGADVGTPEIYIRMGTTSTTPATWYSWYKVGLELAT